MLLAMAPAICVACWRWRSIMRRKSCRSVPPSIMSARSVSSSSISGNWRSRLLICCLMIFGSRRIGRGLLAEFFQEVSRLAQIARRGHEIAAASVYRRVKAEIGEQFRATLGVGGVPFDTPDDGGKSVYIHRLSLPMV